MGLGQLDAVQNGIHVVADRFVGVEWRFFAALFREMTGRAMIFHDGRNVANIENGRFFHLLFARGIFGGGTKGQGKDGGEEEEQYCFFHGLTL